MGGWTGEGKDTIEWDGTIRAKKSESEKFSSNAATGTSPFACTSTTLNANLNSDLLDGSHASAFAPAAAGIPSGLIAMWHGTLANIPTGWVLCNGSNGTPDLRDKFVKGAPNAVDPGGTGGGSQHAHTSHGAGLFNHSTKGGNQFPMAGGDTDLYHPDGDVADMGHSLESNEPPYYEIAFIMKT